MYNNTGPRLDGIVVKVTWDNTNNAFLLNGELITGDFILYNRTNHIIDLSDSSISNKGFSLSLTQDGTHNGGTKYTGSGKIHKEIEFICGKVMHLLVLSKFK